MSLFKPGQEVWDLLRGKGEVVEARSDNVVVNFTDRGRICYTPDGRISDRFNRSLYFSKPEVIAATEPPFIPKMRRGQVVCITKLSAPYKLVKAVEIVAESENLFTFMLEGVQLQRKKSDYMIFMVGDKIY